MRVGFKLGIFSNDTRTHPEYRRSFLAVCIPLSAIITYGEIRNPRHNLDYDSFAYDYSPSSFLKRFKVLTVKRVL